MANSIDEYLEILSDAAIPEAYDPLDRYNDFRKVFLETEAGLRVLKQILSWGHILRVSAVKNPVDPYRLAIADGERGLALKIFAIMTVEPQSVKSNQQTTKDEEN